MDSRIYKTFKILTKKQRLIFLSFVLLMFINLFLELFSIGIFIPIIDELSSNGSDSIMDRYLPPSITLSSFLIYSVVIYVFKTAFSVFLIFSQNKYVYSIEKNISITMLNNYLNSSFQNISKINTSIITKRIINDSSTFAIVVLNNGILMLSELIVLIGLFSFLIYINFKVSLLILLIFLIFVLLFFRTTRRVNNKLNIERSKIDYQRFKILNELLLSVKDIIINNKQKYFVAKYKNVSGEHEKVSYLKNSLIQVPRTVLDFILFLSFALLLIVLLKTEAKMDKILPILSIFAVSSIRIFPSFNRVMSNYQNIKLHSSIIDEIYSNTNVVRPKIYIDDFDIPFRENIEFTNVNFQYSTESILKNLSFKINKNSIFGIYGPSGSGKSTIVNLLTGLLKPNSGTIYIDGKSYELDSHKWRDKIGYLNQDFYIIDGPLVNNIAFGVDENDIDFDGINYSVKLACLNLNTNTTIRDFTVHEHGKNLSGGQKQRLALSRALYKKTEILILDEATSALDSNTEKEILEELLKLKSTHTIVIITHNFSVLSYCDAVLNLS
jgi:ABC-type multidrug transport system fused ATPase/permease subunit